jgi:PAS domain S-box-containing protein
MTKFFHNPTRGDTLRSRAVAHLKGRNAEGQARLDASAALAVLYDLAASPSTAPDALVLLHELQVHQVELDLQDEELRRSCAELESSLHRQVQLYEHAPVGYFIVDFDAVLRELNQTGAALLGFERDFLRGRSLESFLTAEGASILRAMLARLAKGTPAEFADVTLKSPRDGGTACMHASACLDPAGGGYLIGLIGFTGKKATPGFP